MCEKVVTVRFDDPIVAIGRKYQGDYAKSPEYIVAIQEELKEAGLNFVENKVLGVYYDNPEKTAADKLESFHGVILRDANMQAPPTMEALMMAGQWLHTSVTGDPMTSLLKGYQALFDYMGKNGIVPASSAGYQIATFVDGVVRTDIYMALSD